MSMKISVYDYFATFLHQLQALKQIATIKWKTASCKLPITSVGFLKKGIFQEIELIGDKRLYLSKISD